MGLLPAKVLPTQAPTQRESLRIPNSISGFFGQTRKESLTTVTMATEGGLQESSTVAVESSTVRVSNTFLLCFF